MWKAGINAAIVAGKDQGKSWLASLLSSCALDHQDYVVASNILCKRWTPEGRWEEAYPRDYHKVRSYYDLFQVIESALRRLQKIFFVLDEAGALAKGFQKGETSLQAHVRDNVAFMAVSRHLQVATILITQSLENIGTTFRSYEGGLLDYVITKPPLPGYDRKEVARFETEDGRVAWRHVGPYGLAHPEEWAREKPGRIVYADSVASFDVGKYPGTRINFRLRELLGSLSDQLPDRYADIIRYHLDHPPVTTPPEGRKVAPDDSGPKQIGSIDKERDVEGPIGVRIKELLEQGMTPKAVIDMVGERHRSMVYYKNQELHGKFRDRRRNPG